MLLVRVDAACTPPRCNAMHPIFVVGICLHWIVQECRMVLHMLIVVVCVQEGRQGLRRRNVILLYTFQHLVRTPTHYYSLTHSLLLTITHSLTYSLTYSLTHYYSLTDNLVQTIVFLIALTLVFIWTMGSLCSYMFVVVTRVRAFENLRRALRLRSGNIAPDPHGTSYILTDVLTCLLTHSLTW